MKLATTWQSPYRDSRQPPAVVFISPSKSNSGSSRLISRGGRTGGTMTIILKKMLVLLMLMVEQSLENEQEGCGGTIINSGVIMSPGQPYRTLGVNCTWFVRAAVGNNTFPENMGASLEILMEVQYFDIDVPVDTFDIYRNETLILSRAQHSFPISPGSMHFEGDLLTVVYSSAPGAQIERQGFHIEVTAKHCFEEIHRQGTITMPNFPTYVNNLTCIWNLYTSDDQQLLLEFGSFNLAEDENRIEVYVGDFMYRSYSAPSFKPSLDLLLGNVTLKFNTDGNGTRTGFSIRVHSIECGKKMEGSGVITSPVYPASFSGGALCTWHLDAEPGKLVVLSFWDVNIQESGQSLRIFSPPTTLKKTYRGRLQKHSLLLNSSAKVIFRSSTENEPGRFVLAFTSVESCGGSITGFGRIQSPDYPQDYPDDIRCSWHFKPTPGYLALLYIEKIDIDQDGFDRLEVYQGTSLIKTYNGSHASRKMHLKSDVEVVFITNSGGGRCGFSMSFNSTDCITNIHGSGVVESPDYPYPFPENITCIWNLYAESGKRLHLTFSSWNMSGAESVLELYVNGSYVKHYPADWETLHELLGSTATLRLSTGLLATESRFQIRVASVDCGGNVTEMGTIQSPSYYTPSSVYPDNITCTWYLKAAPGKVLILNVEEMELYDDQFDRVELYKGEQLVRTFKGQNDHEMISLGSEGRIVFITNAGGCSAGFSISFTSEECGQTMTESGILQSFDSPFEYPANALCKWNLTAEVGKVILLEFVVFDLGESNSSLEIYEDGALRSRRYTGEVAKHAIVLGRSASVIFRSDERASGPGFYIVFSSMWCGGAIVGPGVVTFVTPDVRSAYPKNVTCTWNLQALPHEKIHVRILSVSNHPSFTTFVVLYDGGRRSISSTARSPGFEATLTNTATVTFTRDLCSLGSFAIAVTSVADMTPQRGWADAK